MVVSCGSGDAAGPDPDLGGDATRHALSRNSLAFPAPNLTPDERRRFEVGDSFFTKNWVTAPASTDARDGLGPTFIGQACSSCHVLDGRGAPPDPEGVDARLGLLLRLSVPGDTPTGAPAAHPAYGDQLQDKANLGVPAEGRIAVELETIDGEYGDGTPFTLTRPTYTVADAAFGPLGEETMVSPRLAPQVIGAGLLEAVPEETILAASDPVDADGDGISGRPNTVFDQRTGRSDARPVRMEGQRRHRRAAGSRGVPRRSRHHVGAAPGPGLPAGQTDCAAAISGGEPELTDDRLAAVTFYGRTLAVPAMRDADDEDVQDGFALFESLGCTACHTPTLQTGETDIAALSDQEIHPYTDLLLHDMGAGPVRRPARLRRRPEEWRTPPLWGIGIVDEVNGEPLPAPRRPRRDARGGDPVARR